ITPPLKHLLARGLLALAFAFAQQQAVLHWLSHAIEAPQAKAGNPLVTHHCDECVATAALGAAAPSPDFALPIVLAQQAPSASPYGTAAPAAPRPGIRARAPPILS
ncbi:MAG: hypothetical protein ABIV63_20195, partial [Caldimonas sp.]